MFGIIITSKAWSGENPNIGHFETFGNIAFVHKLNTIEVKQQDHPKVCLWAMKGNHIGCIFQLKRRHALVEMLWWLRIH